MVERRIAVTGAVFIAGAMIGAYLSLRQGPAPEADAGAAAKPPELVFYTNPGATTPQLPFWGAITDTENKPLFTVRTETWTATTQLQSLLLAGKGDLWLGHVDGFARAWRRGAPLVMLAVTGWRKMSLVSVDPHVRCIDDVLDTILPYAPVGSPGVPILQALLGADSGRVRLEPHEPRQLSLKLMNGRATTALLPEPLVTTLLNKVEGMRVVASLEQEYARRTGGEPRMPLAGLAVHRDVARRYPERIETLLALMMTTAEAMKRAPETAPNVLPAAFADFVPPKVVRDSLARDLILVLPARDVVDEIDAYLRLVAPDVFVGETNTVHQWAQEGFVWMP